MADALLQAKNLSISFGGVHAVQQLSFSVYKGEILGLIGPNGAGKSTCVNLISGILRQDSGEIVFDGHLLNPQKTISDRVSLGIGRTFQTPRPFGNMTVFDNVLTVALQKSGHKAAREKVEYILEITELKPFSKMISAKLPIEKRKWLDLARVLANDPKFVMLDEVMAGLNQIEMESSLELIRKINSEGITILFIEHVMSAVVKICSRVVVINEGRFLSEGGPHEVLADRKVITAYIGGQDDA